MLPFNTQMLPLGTGILGALICVGLVVVRSYGFFTQVAHREGDTYMTFQNDVPATLHVDSGLEATPDWVVYDQLVLSPDPTLRTVTAIDPGW